MIYFLKFEHAKRFIVEALEKQSVDNEIAVLAAEGMVHTSLRGVDTHGIRLLTHYLEGFKQGRLNPKPVFHFEITTPSTGKLDADHTVGYAACMVAMRHAINLARKSGIGFVSVKNSSHCGALSYYGFEAAKQNMIGLGCTHATPRMKSPGSNQLFLGTNPICFTAPTNEEEPMCYDSAPTMLPFHAIINARETGVRIPEDVASDELGNMTTDPNKATQLLPIGNYKGFGLSLIADILSGLLSGMPVGNDISQMYGDMSEKRYLGQFFGAIRIDAFEDPALFKQRLTETAEKIRSLSADDPKVKNALPGDPEKEIFNVRTVKGIPFSHVDKEKFDTITKEYGLNPLDYNEIE